MHRLRTSLRNKRIFAAFAMDDNASSFFIVTTTTGEDSHFNYEILKEDRITELKTEPRCRAYNNHVFIPAMSGFNKSIGVAVVTFFNHHYGFAETLTIKCSSGHVCRWSNHLCDTYSDGGDSWKIFLTKDARAVICSTSVVRSICIDETDSWDIQRETTGKIKVHELTASGLCLSVDGHVSMIDANFIFPDDYRCIAKPDPTIPLNISRDTDNVTELLIPLRFPFHLLFSGNSVSLMQMWDCSSKFETLPGDWRDEAAKRPLSENHLLLLIMRYAGVASSRELLKRKRSFD